MDVKTVLLDVDGTLLDSRELVLAAFEHALDSIGWAVPERVGVEGGRNLGALTVGALYGFHGAEVLAARPDRAIEAIAELPDVLA